MDRIRNFLPTIHLFLEEVVEGEVEFLFSHSLMERILELKVFRLDGHATNHSQKFI